MLFITWTLLIWNLFIWIYSGWRGAWSSWTSGLRCRARNIWNIEAWDLGSRFAWPALRMALSTGNRFTHMKACCHYIHSNSATKSNTHRHNCFLLHLWRHLLTVSATRGESRPYHSPAQSGCDVTGIVSPSPHLPLPGAVGLNIRPWWSYHVRNAAQF
jgi:hypothetical protein